MHNITSNNGQFYWWFGCVEDRSDPLRMGRCRVRIMGYHIPDNRILPTEDLPWAVPVGPSTSAGTSGVGWSPTGPVEGSWVVGFFADGQDGQHPMFFGTIGAIPGGLNENTDCSEGSNGMGNTGNTGNTSNGTGSVDVPVSGATGDNAKAIFQTAKNMGYDDYMAIAFVALAEKESGLQFPRAENMNYTAGRIREVWPKKPGAVAYAHQPEALANYVYGSVNGNRGGRDGWNYRGKGFNQLTGRGNYRLIGSRIGADLEGNPDLLLTDKTIAIKAFFAFYVGNVRSKTASSQAEANRIITDATGGRPGFSTATKFGRQNLAKVESFSRKYTAASLSA